MIYVYSFLIIAASSLLWRIRGGLWKDKIPANKVWYAVFFAIVGLFYYNYNIDNAVIGFIACYVSYQLYGWGEYIGGLISEESYNREEDAECELIDDILYKSKWLLAHPRVFGFCGTCLTGLIITFLWGLYFNNLIMMLSGLGMGVCYWLGYLLNKHIPELKQGWGYGEYICGAYWGVILAWQSFYL